MVAGSTDYEGCVPVVCICLNQINQDEEGAFSQPKIADPVCRS